MVKSNFSNFNFFPLVFPLNHTDCQWPLLYFPHRIYHFVCRLQLGVSQCVQRNLSPDVPIQDRSSVTCNPHETEILLNCIQPSSSRSSSSSLATRFSFQYSAYRWCFRHSYNVAQPLNPLRFNEPSYTSSGTHQCLLELSEYFSEYLSFKDFYLL